ncbi:MAG: alpha/beta fold hydrolase [Janthinobacterium lividum]
MRRAIVFLCLFMSLHAAQAADKQFTTSDGVRLHLIEAGPPNANTIVFVPGWTMPAWIFQLQVNALSARYHVVALDPRGQGYSDVPSTGYDHLRRGQDIAELIQSLGSRTVVLVGWSLGVLDSLAYVQQYGDRRLAGLVLIDNSIGENPPPSPSRAPVRRGPRLNREQQMQRFVAGMFNVNPGAAYLEQLTEAALRTPPDAAAALANYSVPRTYWRQAVYAVQKPILYVVRPRFAAQAANLATNDPLAETAVFTQAGHALFVDEPARFNALLESFVRRRVWP